MADDWQPSSSNTNYMPSHSDRPLSWEEQQAERQRYWDLSRDQSLSRSDRQYYYNMWTHWRVPGPVSWTGASAGHAELPEETWAKIQKKLEGIESYRTPTTEKALKQAQGLAARASEALEAGSPISRALAGDISEQMDYYQKFEKPRIAEDVRSAYAGTGLMHAGVRARAEAGAYEERREQIEAEAITNAIAASAALNNLQSTINQAANMEMDMIAGENRNLQFETEVFQDYMHLETEVEIANAGFETQASIANAQLASAAQAQHYQTWYDWEKSQTEWDMYRDAQSKKKWWEGPLNALLGGISQGLGGMLGDWLTSGFNAGGESGAGSGGGGGGGGTSTSTGPQPSGEVNWATSDQAGEVGVDYYAPPENTDYIGSDNPYQSQYWDTSGGAETTSYNPYGGTSYTYGPSGTESSGSPGAEYYNNSDNSIWYYAHGDRYTSNPSYYDSGQYARDRGQSNSNVFAGFE